MNLKLSHVERSVILSKHEQPMLLTLPVKEGVVPFVRVNVTPDGAAILENKCNINTDTIRKLLKKSI